MDIDTKYLEKCVRKMIEGTVLDGFHSTVADAGGRGVKVELRGEEKKLEFSDLDEISNLFRSKEINFTADADGSGCDSCGYYGEGVLVVTVYRAAIKTEGVEPDLPPPPPKKVKREKAPKPPKPPKPPKRAKGSYIIVAQTEAHAKDWCMGKNFAPGQAVLCDNECKAAIGLSRKNFKIVTVGSRKPLRFTRDLVNQLKKMGFKMYRGFQIFI